MRMGWEGSVHMIRHGERSLEVNETLRPARLPSVRTFVLPVTAKAFKTGSKLGRPAKVREKLNTGCTLDNRMRRVSKELTVVYKGSLPFHNIRVVSTSISLFSDASFERTPGNWIQCGKKFSVWSNQKRG